MQRNGIEQHEIVGLLKNDGTDLSLAAAEYIQELIWALGTTHSILSSLPCSMRDLYDYSEWNRYTKVKYGYAEEEDDEEDN